METLQIRIQDGDGPTLVYLPGTHGDWTLNSSFRREMRGRARFIEFTYPRTRDWSLSEYANAIDQTLTENGIERGWILAESFASQVAWAWISQKHQFHIEGIILAGGFVRHPIIPAVHLAKFLTLHIPSPVLKAVLWCYTIYARLRECNSPEVKAALSEFIRRRTPEDLLAAVHRLDLIARNDLRSVARIATVPIYYLTGFIDPIVPWPFVSHSLCKQCVGLRNRRIIFTADHHVLGAARKSSEQILEWIAHESNLILGSKTSGDSTVHR